MVAGAAAGLEVSTAAAAAAAIGLSAAWILRNRKL